MFLAAVSLKAQSSESGSDPLVPDSPEKAEELAASTGSAGLRFSNLQLETFNFATKQLVIVDDSNKGCVRAQLSVRWGATGLHVTLRRGKRASKRCINLDGRPACCSVHPGMQTLDQAQTVHWQRPDSRSQA